MTLQLLDFGSRSLNRPSTSSSSSRSSSRSPLSRPTLQTVTLQPIFTAARPAPVRRTPRPGAPPCRTTPLWSRWPHPRQAWQPSLTSSTPPPSLPWLRTGATDQLGWSHSKGVFTSGKIFVRFSLDQSRMYLFGHTAVFLKESQDLTTNLHVKDQQYLDKAVWLRLCFLICQTKKQDSHNASVHGSMLGVNRVCDFRMGLFDTST